MSWCSRTRPYYPVLWRWSQSHLPSFHPEQEKFAQPYNRRLILTTHDRARRKTAPTPVFPGTTVAGINVKMPTNLVGPHGEDWARLFPTGRWDWVRLTETGQDPAPEGIDG